MHKFFLIGIMGLFLTACSPALEDSEFAMKLNSEKRKPKHQLMPPEEKPIEPNSKTENILPFTPQVGIRIPLKK